MKAMRRVRRWAGRIGLRHTLAFGLSTAALGSGVATYLALTGTLPFGPHPNAVLTLLNLDLVLLLALGALIAKRLLQVWAERRRGLAGSRLQIRLVVLFSLIAVLPTIIVAVFSYLFFSYGVESWFSDKVRTAISESVVVAEAYLHEHQQAIRADALAMANDLNRNAAELGLDPRRLEQVVSAQAALRGLTEAMVFDRAGHVLARSSLSFALGFEPVPSDAMHVADQGDVAIMTNDNDDRVRALVRLDGFGHVYLYVGRYIEARVLNHIEETQRAAAQYQKMESRRSGFQVTFALIFLMVAMLFLVAAVAVGIHFATQLAVPISRLAVAAEQVRAGDLAARVPEGEKDDELASLSRAFNRMTNQIESQQRELQGGQSAARRAAPLHRNGADRRLGRGDRARSQRPGQPAQPLGLGIARGRSRTVDRAGPRRSRARDGGAAGRGRAPPRPPGAVAGSARPRQQHPHAAGAHRRRPRRP